MMKSEMVNKMTRKRMMDLRGKMTQIMNNIILTKIMKVPMMTYMIEMIRNIIEN